MALRVNAMPKRSKACFVASSASPQPLPYYPHTRLKCQPSRYTSELSCTSLLQRPIAKVTAR